MAWVYLGLHAGTSGLLLALLARTDPALLAERMRIGPGAKRWDVALVSLMAVVGPAGTLATAGLDARFGWTGPMAWPATLAALVVMTAGIALIAWAMLRNPFFSSVVRIQGERGHRVVSAGPYRYVRHPGYSGAALVFAAMPIVLGSHWALLPAAATICVTVVRTALEDRTLHRELAGYAAYAGRVRYRLLPGIW